LDLTLAVIDLTSLVTSAFIIYVGYKAIRAFRQSKQAVVESAGILEAIVSALTSRIETSTLQLADLREDLHEISQRSVELEGEQTKLRNSHVQTLKNLQETLSNFTTLTSELETVKTHLNQIQANQAKRGSIAKRVELENESVPVPGGDVLNVLTPTERHVLEILAGEGPKAAPELGRRMRKSREHMARLMKRLYLEGYVDRETNHAPFRYKLNDKIQPLMGSDVRIVTAEE
jgi:DNA-binding MarR family transcriptional regulator